MASPSEYDLAICGSCGTQFDFAPSAAPVLCIMCQEPRQFVPAAGQAWHTIASLRTTHTTTIQNASHQDPHIWSLAANPPFAIGQRALLIETPAGNILWDCQAYLSLEAIAWIHARGGLKAIAISHPHFYTSHLTWAEEFDCPVYLAAEEEEWLQRTDPKNRRRFVTEDTQELLPGVTYVKLGGHFPGSSILHYGSDIFTGDTFGFALSGLRREHHTKAHQVFMFHYAQPNFVPLGPSAMLGMWKKLRKWEFTGVHSLFHGWTLHEKRAKGLVLESMQRQARHEEWDDHELLRELCD